MSKKTILVTMVVSICLLCSIEVQGFTKVPTIPQVEVENSQIGPAMGVFDKNMGLTFVNIETKPALLFPWQCISNDDVLKEVAKYSPNDRPHLVFCHNHDNQHGLTETLTLYNYVAQDIVNCLIEEKLAKNGLKDADYYISTGSSVQKEPILIAWLEGELTKANPSDLTELQKQINDTLPKIIGQAEIRIGTGNGAINASLAGQAIDGFVIPPGEVFSFNDVVGERTPAKGYVPAMQVISTENGFQYADGVGGGICRTSSVLHWTVLAIGLEIVEYHKHSLPVDYEPDAAVAWGGWDYRFKNDTPYPIVITCKVVGENQVVELWQN